MSTTIGVLTRVVERAVLAEVATIAGLAEQLTVARLRATPPVAIERARLRRVAIYLLAVELQIPNADIARALGMSRQNVHQARLAIEDLRDRPAVDAMLERCRTVLSG